MEKKKDRLTLSQWRKDIKSTFYMLKAVWRFTPSYLVLTLLEGVIYGIANAFISVIFVKMLFDALEAGKPFENVLIILLLIAGCTLLRMAYSYTYGWWYKQAIKQKLMLRMQEVLFKKAKELDLSCYDDPEFYNNFVWAINEADARASGVVEAFNYLLNQLVNSAMVVTVLITIDPIIVAISLVSSVISAWMMRRMNKIGVKRQEEQMPYNRRQDYVKRTYTLPEYAKEMRIGHAPRLLRKQYDEAMVEKEKLSKKYGFKQFLNYMYSDFFTYFLAEGGIYVYLVVQLFTGAITLGGFAATSNAVFNLYWQFSNIAKSITSFTNHGLFAEKYRTFLEYEPKIVGGDKEAGEVTSLAFENVSFRYPDTEKDSLSDVSFTINKGERVAIVGYNGAGKTTLIKLLLRLYDPTEGAVLINGENIKEYGVEGYRDRFGTVFQDFQIFASSIAENVIAGSYTPDLEGKVVDALTKSTFLDKLEKLEKGVDTPLTREFDEEGVNLSGGEAQKVAIARVFAHGGDVIVMDEPSSALDPMSEYELNQTILSYAQDKTVIFISHRLSTTRMADRILMFADGKLIEDGSHEELMKAGGKYAEMFNMQAEKYTKQKGAQTA